VAEGPPKSVVMPPKKLADVNPVLAKRLFGVTITPDAKNGKPEYHSGKPEYNIFHVLGLDLPDTKDAAAGPEAMPPVRPPMDGMNKPGKGGPPGANLYFDAWSLEPPEGGLGDKMGDNKGLKPPMVKNPMGDPMKKGPNKGDPIVPEQPAFPVWERDGLVRFIDPDVVPGRKYQYLIQVRMKNPNFGKNEVVAFKALADMEELPPSEWKLTPIVTIPEDYYLYAVAQQAIDDAKNIDGKKKNTPPDLTHVKDQTSFQIHQWTETAVIEKDNDRFVIGDWVIAKKQIVKRGESIGAKALVHAPVWDKDQDVFEVPKQQKDPNPKAKKNSLIAGFHMDFNKSEADRPILVDFTGGKRVKNGALEEETAVEALVLAPDGSLIVLNSRTSDANPRDGADGIQADIPEGVRRQQRFEAARRRSLDVQGLQSRPIDLKGGTGGMKLPGA
jgi:hypothetical protein